MVVRTEPRNWVTDFEPNFLAFVEFYDEDFPWRYTPAPPDAATHRLTPWLTLLVLEEDEFERNRAPARPLPSIRIKRPTPPSIFPPDDQLWAWAHVQIERERWATAHAPEPRRARHAAATAIPTAASRRLISPRRLQPEHRYYAFVVPTFEVGRKAGLGVDSTIDATPGSKLVVGRPARRVPGLLRLVLPHRRGRRLRGAGRRALKPRPIDPARRHPRHGHRSSPASACPPSCRQSGDDRSRGRRRPRRRAASRRRCEPKPLDPASTFPPSRRDRQPAGRRAARAATAIRVVAPPLHGGWHALVDRVDAGRRPTQLDQRAEHRPALPRRGRAWARG